MRAISAIFVCVLIAACDDNESPSNGSEGDAEATVDAAEPVSAETDAEAGRADAAVGEADAADDLDATPEDDGSALDAAEPEPDASTPDAALSPTSSWRRM